MKKSIYLSLATAVVFTASINTVQAGPKEDAEMRQAKAIFERFRMMPEQEIPYEVLRGAHGVAIMTVAKGGFIWSGKGGDGVVIARNGRSWSSPSFIRTGGVGFGAQIGGSVTEFVFILNTPEAVQAFARGNVQLGGALSVAAGPVGRAVEAGVTPKAAIYSYSRSQGLFAGVSVEGTVVSTDKKANARYYGRPVEAGAILSGKVRGPRGSTQLVTSL